MALALLALFSPAFRHISYGRVIRDPPLATPDEITGGLQALASSRQTLTKLCSSDAQDLAKSADHLISGLPNLGERCDIHCPSLKKAIPIYFK
jgi:hypothetical protein